MISALKPIQSKIAELMTDPEELSRLMAKGAQRARFKASQTLKRLHRKLGLIELL